MIDIHLPYQSHKDMPCIEEIHSYWKDWILSIRKDPNKCWGCQKYDHNESERAHIIALCNQTNENREWINDASNLLLLCGTCHRYTEGLGEEKGVRRQAMMYWLVAFKGVKIEFVSRLDEIFQEKIAWNHFDKAIAAELSASTAPLVRTLPYIAKLKLALKETYNQNKRLFDYLKKSDISDIEIQKLADEIKTNEQYRRSLETELAKQKPVTDSTKISKPTHQQRQRQHLAERAEKRRHKQSKGSGISS
jgi:hypothetical protein